MQSAEVCIHCVDTLTSPSEVMSSASSSDRQVTDLRQQHKRVSDEFALLKAVVSPVSRRIIEENLKK